MNKAVIARVDMNKAVIARVDIVRVAIRVFCACRVVVHLPVCLHLREKKLNTTKQKDNHKKERYSFFCARRRARRSLLPRTRRARRKRTRKTTRKSDKKTKIYTADREET
jgi:hypothetical protein